MPPTLTPAKRRRARRLLSSPASKIAGVAVNAVFPLLFLRLSWNRLLLDPTNALTSPLLPTIFILQTAFIILLLPLHTTSKKPPKKRGTILVDSLGDALRAVAVVLLLTFLTDV